MLNNLWFLDIFGTFHSPGDHYKIQHHKMINTTKFTGCCQTKMEVRSAYPDRFFCSPWLDLLFFSFMHYVKAGCLTKPNWNTESIITSLCKRIEYSFFWMFLLDYQFWVLSHFCHFQFPSIMMTLSLQTLMLLEYIGSITIRICGVPSLTSWKVALLK